MLATLAVVVIPRVSSPTPPAPTTPTTPAVQQQCEYSVKVGGDKYSPVYKCMTQYEYDKYNADNAEAEAQKNAQTAEWLSKYWWILAIIGVLFVILIFWVLSY